MVGYAERMAKLSKPPIPLKLYKHFAVATLTLTAMIAMFADSGKREAIAGHIEERERQTELQIASAEITGQRELILAADKPRGSFGDEGGGFGAPTVQTGGSGSTLAPAPSRNGRRVTAAGYDPEYIESMSQEEYEAFLKAVPAAARAEAISPEERARRRAQVESASARRAGNRGHSADAPAS